MGTVQKINEKYDILDDEQFKSAMKEMASVSEGELHFYLAYDTNGQTSAFKKEYALCAAENGKRAAASQVKLARLSGYFGAAGILVGALVQIFATYLMRS